MRTSPEMTPWTKLGNFINRAAEMILKTEGTRKDPPSLLQHKSTLQQSGSLPKEWLEGDYLPPKK